MSENVIKPKVKPLFLITRGAMTPRDIRRAERETGICICECESPEAVRLLEPPIDADMDTQARAALSLARMIVNHDGGISTYWTKGALQEYFVRCLMAPPPRPVGAVAKVKK